MHIFVYSFYITKLRLKQWPSLLIYSKDVEVNKSSLIASCQSETSSTIPSLDVDGYAGISVPWKTSKEVTLEGKSLIMSRFYIISTSCTHSLIFLLMTTNIILIIYGALKWKRRTDLTELKKFYVNYIFLAIRHCD